MAQQQQQQYPTTSTIPTLQQQQQYQHQHQQPQPYHQQPPYHHHNPYEYIPQPPSHHHHHHQPHPLNQQPLYPHHQYPHPHHQYVPHPMPPPAHYPLPPYPYPTTSSDHPHQHHRPSSKRPREREVAVSDEAVPASKRQAVVVGNDILFRVVVPSGQIGKVIGKGGHRVQKVRDDTKATIKIADPISRFEERVIIISSKEKSDGGMTDAEKALLQISSLILVDDGSGAQAVSIAAADPYGTSADISAGHVATNAVKLLIAGSQAGGLIGVSGQNIEKLRISSGASIAVLAPNQLPLCASAHESDRLVQISGEVSAVLKAVEEIGVELRANPPKQVISISPTYNLSIARTQQYMDPNAAECVTLDMVISETMVGGLIGRAGSNIGRIRTESGAMIKVFGAKGEQKHRQIQLIGAAQQVALAKQRVDEYIYTQLTQQSGPE